MSRSRSVKECHNRGVAGGGFADSTKKVEILTFFLLSGLWARLGALAGRRKCKAKKLGLALTIGGGMSNWYDRHKRGYGLDRRSSADLCSMFLISVFSSELRC